ncbi:MAG: hypothetical protein J6W63_12385, partial [Treponema sp.]|nr:hypothetical protein [Treponema sp.]
MDRKAYMMGFLNFLFPPDEKELFEKNKVSINVFEYMLLRLCLNVSVGVSLLLIFFSIPPFSEKPIKYIYIFFALLTIAIRIFIQLFKKAASRCPQPFLYVFFVFLAGFSILVNFKRSNTREFVTAICFL